MVRYLLAADDLARVRIGSASGALAETVFAFDALRRRGSRLRFGDWRGAVAGRLASNVAMLCDLLTPGSAVDLPTIGGRASGLDEGLDTFLGAPRWVLDAELGGAMGDHRPATWVRELVDRDGRARERLAATVRDLHSVAIAPYWERMAAVLEAERARLVRTMSEQGVDALLGALHPAIHWVAPVLEIDLPWQSSRVRPLGGRGLVVEPSLFCPPGHALCSDLRDPDGPFTLVYPAPRDLVEIRSLWVSDRAMSKSLAALIGPTRAAVLEAIAASPCTTSQTAQRCGISLASASEHAAVLRGAGLVTTQRDGRAVLHSITPLGAKLLE